MFYLGFIVFVLGVSLLLYVLFGGADYGAGILELFAPGKKQNWLRSMTYRAIGPVWEANHIWIILVIVILFAGFPAIFASLSTYLHVPLLLLLLGIIFRGAAFAFRHYDAIQDESQRVYNQVFRWSSLFTPFFLGVTAGATQYGLIPAEIPNSFYAGYVAPWLNGFSLSMGVFVSAICAYLAAAFLLGETRDDQQQPRLARLGRISALAVVLAGGLVFLASWLSGVGLLQRFLGSPLSLGILLAATLSLPFLLKALRKRQPLKVRLLAGGQVTCIVLAWLAAQFPVVIRLRDGSTLDVLTHSAATGSLIPLFWALVVGVFLIFPALGYLLWVFKGRALPPEGPELK